MQPDPARRGFFPEHYDIVKWHNYYPALSLKLLGAFKLFWWSNLETWQKKLKCGRVEKTDPRSADYPLTPAPRTTLWTTPRTTRRVVHGVGVSG